MYVLYDYATVVSVIEIEYGRVRTYCVHAFLDRRANWGKPYVVNNAALPSHYKKNTK